MQIYRNKSLIKHKSYDSLVGISYIFTVSKLHLYYFKMIIKIINSIY